MAHMKKFKAVQVPQMLAHYGRTRGDISKYGNQEIDPQRTYMNYNLAPHDGSQLDYIYKRMDEIKVHKRKDVNIICDWVVTAPENVPEADLKAFFKNTYDFMENRYGKANVVSAHVHMDETTPHIHFCFMPVTAENKLCAKKVVCRTDLKTFHGDLMKYLEMKMGYAPSILLEEKLNGQKSIQELKEKSALERMAEIKKEWETVSKDVELLLKLYAAKKSALDKETGIVEIDGEHIKKNYIKKGMFSKPEEVIEIDMDTWNKFKANVGAFINMNITLERTNLEINRIIESPLYKTNRKLIDDVYREKRKNENKQEDIKRLTSRVSELEECIDELPMNYQKQIMEKLKGLTGSESKEYDFEIEY